MCYSGNCKYESYWGECNGSGYKKQDSLCFQECDNCEHYTFDYYNCLLELEGGHCEFKVREDLKYDTNRNR